MKPFAGFLCVLAVFAACSLPTEKKLPPFKEAVASLYDSALKPFYHGVASGDPLTDRVVLWTRVTPDDSVGVVPVMWELAEDPGFTIARQTDTVTASFSRDYTVKVDAGNLKPGQTYYYRFSALGKFSPLGRTRTAPDGPSDSLKFAIVSCANWEWGYFNAYDKIAGRNDLAAVLHLGDYIYEHGVGQYGDTTIGRLHLPPHEIVTLQDYRTRYSQYRLDRGLRRVHQQHPFIPIWDDHEIANNSTAVGAQNHQPEKEGDYANRKAVARQAYYEWLPIRESGNLYRAYSFGKLADVIMLDERLAGRSAEIESMQDPAYTSPQRTMLGTPQLQWFEATLKSSTATWKVIGNQVIFSDVNLTGIFRGSSRNLDAWDGFPAEKKTIVDFITSNNIEDIIITSGDTHASWAIEAATNIGKSYKPFAVELGTTSVSSGNGDEGSPPDTVKKREAAIQKLNPHIRYGNNRDHGYLLLSLFPGKARAEWYFVTNLRQPQSDEVLGKRFEFSKGSHTLREY